MLRHALCTTIAALLVAPALRADDESPAGIYHAKEVPGSPTLKASGMAWHKGKLVVVDRGNNRLLVHTPPDQFETLREIANPVGVAFDPRGNLIVTTRDPSRILRFGPQGKQEVLAEGDAVGTPQAVIVHPSGRIIWTGFPDAGTRSLMPGDPVESLSPRILHSFGIALSPKHDSIYVTTKVPDPSRRGVYRFPITAGGAIGRGEFSLPVAGLKLTLDGLPPARDGANTLQGWIGRVQGLAIDHLGHFYVAGAEAHTSGQAVAVISPDGTRVVAMILDVPTNISCLAWGGDDGRILYIAGAGSYRLHQVRLPAAGVR